MGVGSIENNRAFYKGKRVFITGHNGFNGAWLVGALHELGAVVRGYAGPAAPGGAFERMRGEELIDSQVGDILNYEQLRDSILEFQPDIVMHLAAIAIVKDCFDHPRKAFDINVMGTVNVFEAVRECPSVKCVLVVTTDKVYENKGDGAVYQVGDPLGGIDPYSNSKTCMEFVCDCYRYTYLQKDGKMVGVATSRTANAIGGGDNHTDSRLVPQLLKGIAENNPVQLRNPHQTRPWQEVLDAINGYLSLCRLMCEDPEKYSGAWNIGPTLDGIREVSWIVEKMQEFFADAKVEVGEKYKVKESATLGLDISKTLELTDWQPEIPCERMLYNVVDYFKKQQAGMDERDILLGQVRTFYGIEG